MTDLEALEIIRLGTRLYNKTILNNLELKEYLNNRYSDIPLDMFSYKEVLYRIEHNIDIRPVCRVCGNSVAFIGDINGKSINGYRMSCSHKCHGLDKVSIEKCKISKLERSDELKNLEKIRRELTCITRFGEKNAFAAKKREIKDTMIQRYGGYTMLSNKLKNKVRTTNFKKYGVDNVFASSKIQKKIRTTNFKKYGVTHFSKTLEGKKKLSLVAKLTLNKRYDTLQKRYGVKYILDNPLFAQKRLNTLRKNNTFNTSKIELEFKEYLILKFPNGVLCLYKSAVYPFSCDFYIKPLELYIELLGSWTHGGHPFDETDINDINILNTMKLKNSKYYLNAIKTWTIRDVNKRNIAKLNNLNYLEIFSNDINEVISIFEEFVNNRKS